MKLARRRLFAQRLAGPPCASPAQAVRSMGAVQAQDFYGALWALGLRSAAPTEAKVEEAIARREIVRTWPLRGTLHFVAAEDARWMLELGEARTLRAAAKRHHDLGLDDEAFARSGEILSKALSGGRRMTRTAVYVALEKGGVSPEGQRGIHILQGLALARLICFGPREGKQQTFVLFDEWIEKSRRLAGDEALAELARRYFAGHGPATLQDFAWWSGFTAGEARRALELVKPELDRDGALWSGPAGARTGSAPRALLLPAFDELLVGYRDRSAALDPRDAPRVHQLLSPTVLLDGRVVGTWTRTLEADRVKAKLTLFRQADAPRPGALNAAVRAYGHFLGREVVGLA